MEEPKRTFDEEIDYETELSNHSDVIYRYLYPQNSASATVTSGGTYGPTSIITPPSAFNFFPSSLNFQVQMTATSNAYNYINANGLTVINRKKIFDQFSNAVWMDVSNFNNAMSVLVPSCTKLTTFLTKSFYGPVSGTRSIPSTSSAVSQLAVMEDISRFSDTPTVVQGTNATNPAGYVSAYTAPQNIVGSYPAGTSFDLFPQNPYTCRRQFYISASSNVASYVDYNIPLSSVKCTVCAVDKVLWNASNLQTDILWNNTDNFCFTSTDPANPVTGCASYTGTCTIANIALVLANEDNLSLIGNLIKRITTAGLRIQIPWLTATKQTIASGTSHSYQIALSSAYGNSLLAIASVPFPALTAGTNACYANVHNRGYITTYNTFINNVAISNPSAYNCLQCQDYMVGNRKFLRGSTVQSLAEFVNADWQHWDSWVGTKPLYEVDFEKIDGRDLHKQNAVFQLQATLSSAASYAWVNLLVGQKELQLSSQGSLVY